MPSSPCAADGAPFHGSLVAAVDESSPAAAGGIYYVMVAAAVFDVGDAVAAARGVVANRTRPFHWRKEGLEACLAMLKVVTDVCAAVEVRWEPTGRKGQAAARGRLLEQLAGWAQGHGVEHLVIESGDDDSDRADRRVLGGYARKVDALAFVFDHRTKAEPVLWIPDAITGAAGECLIGKTPQFYSVLVDAGLAPESPPSAPPRTDL